MMDYVAVVFTIGIIFWLFVVLVGVSRMRRDRFPSLTNSIEENQLIIGEAYLPIYKNIINAIGQIFREEKF